MSEEGAQRSTADGDEGDVFELVPLSRPAPRSAVPLSQLPLAADPPDVIPLACDADLDAIPTATELKGAPPLPVVAAAHPLAYNHAPRQLLAGADPEFVSRFRDFWVPLGLLTMAFGLAVAVGLQWGDLRTAFVAISTYLVLKSVVMAVAIPLMLRFAGVAFGRAFQALLKLAAIALLPDALGFAMLAFVDGCYALLALPFVVAGTAWTMFACLLDLDHSETSWCMIVLMVCTCVPSALWYQIFQATFEIAV